MSPTVKAKSKKAVPKHRCSRTSIIKRHNILIERLCYVTLGNGTPEDGLLYKFRDFINDNENIKEDIIELKGMVGLALKDAETTRHAFELYRTHEEGASEGEQEKAEREQIAQDLATRQKNDKWQKVIWVIMALLVLAGIGVNIWLTLASK